MTNIRFTIGDAFPAADPIARYITGLAMISNDWLRSMKDILDLAGEDAENMGLRITLFRRQAALTHEAATFLRDAERRFPEIAAFVSALDEPPRMNAKQVLDAVDVASDDYLGDWLEAHRNVTHHVPRLDPAAERHGAEEMATALAAAAAIAGTIDSGSIFGDARFHFADEVAAQLLPSIDDLAWIERLRETAMALAAYAQQAAMAYLESRPAGTFTVEA